MTRQATDQILLQARLDEAASADLVSACNAAAVALAGATVRRVAWSAAEGDAYGYLALPRRQQLDERDLAPVLAAFAGALARHADQAQPRVSRLEQAFERPGASHGAEPAFHYVVEMDPETGWRDELLNWYDTEHMPGLASVPGTVHAARLLNHDHGPLSLACYDLVSPTTLGSPPWLAVRGTEWSSRVRPHFMNTRRTMFKTLS
ncbi:MAG: hypothetical protein V4636_10970 [Pseudomonadota bacterium]